MGNKSKIEWTDATRLLDGREWNEYPSIAEGGA
jgi:hypothetical protein